MATKKAFITRDFNDSGTEQAFTASTAGKPETFPEIDEGSFANYAAAGLVREPTEADTKGEAQPAPTEA
jgi:hypothetical protein